MQTQENIFDEALMEHRKKRANSQGFVSFLHDQVISDLKDRVREQSKVFNNVSIIGPFARYWKRKLYYRHPSSSCYYDEEISLMKEGSRDLIVSALYLHSINDPIARLVQMRRSLKKNGMLLAYAFGENSLFELRKSFEYADLKTFGKIFFRINPMVDIPTFGSLLSRAGFKYCVSDKLSYLIEYNDPMDLLRDIRGMGETNVMIERSRRTLPKKVLMDVINYYRDNYKRISLNKKKYQATFDVICLTGWNSKPSGIK